MVITDFLKMILRYFTPEDKATLFSTWREELNQNFVKIDENAESVNTSLGKKLEKADIKQGTNITIAYDETGNGMTISATGDVSEQDVINAIQEHNTSTTSHEDLREKTNVIVTTGIGNKYLANDGTYKEVQGGGGGGTVFDVEDYDSFTATEDTTTFTIADMTESKLVQIVFEGLELIKDVNYTIDKTTGIVTLGFTLKATQTIYYKLLYGANNAVVYDEASEIEGTVTFDADTLEGHDSSYFVNTTQVVNTTTSIETDGNVLNAVQANPNVEGSLANQITTNIQQIGDSGYLASKEVTNFNILQNGKYLVTLNVASSEAPLTQVTQSKWTLDVTATTGGNTQIATLVWSDLTVYNDRGRAFKRIYVDGAWGAWKEIATTTKTDVTLLNGWSNLDGGPTTIMTAYKNGNLVFISGILQTGTKTDDTTIGVLPVGFRPSKVVIKQGQDQYSTANQFTRCVFNVDANGNIYIGSVTQSYVAFNMTIPIG